MRWMPSVLWWSDVSVGDVVGGVVILDVPRHLACRVWLKADAAALELVSFDDAWGPSD